MHPALFGGRSPIFNYRASQLSVWQTAAAAVRAGSANAKILCIGDSITLGYRSNGTGSGDMKSASFPAKIAQKLTARGLVAQSNSYMGVGDSSPASGDSIQFDPRIVKGSSWSHSVKSLGGSMLKANTTTNALSFTPTNSVDKFDVYFFQTGGLGTFSYDVDGGSATNQSANNGTAKINKVTVSTTLGAHTLNLKYVSGGDVYIAGIDAYDSSTKVVSVINSGWVGSATTQWCPNSNEYDACKALVWVDPDLTIINLGVNDWIALSVPLATFITQYQTIITAAKTAGSVILVTPIPSEPSSGAAPETAIQRTYSEAVKALAIANDLPVVDINGYWQSYSGALNRGYMYGQTDRYHPGPGGLTNIADQIIKLIA